MVIGRVGNTDGAHDPTRTLPVVLRVVGSGTRYMVEIKISLAKVQFCVAVSHRFC